MSLKRGLDGQHHYESIIEVASSILYRHLSKDGA